jgi:L,D-peptidoglycan transpeptidase YkuD (ErfK/YbiS/YcfS/YnhG family)
MRPALLRVLLALAAATALITSSWTVPALAADGQVLSSGQQLALGQQLVSPNGSYVFLMQGDGNAVVYRSGSALWATGTGVAGTVLVMQGDGNLVAYAPGARPVWDTHTGTNPGARVVMQDDGNLVVYRPDGTAVWASKSSASPATAQSGALAAGQLLTAGGQLVSAKGRYVLAMQGDGNLVVYGPAGAVTASGTAVPGTVLVMQGDGNLVAYAPGAAAVWSTGTGTSAGASVVMQDDGNLVVYRPDGSAAWTSSGGLPLPVNTISARQVVTVVAPSAGSTTAQLTAWERRSGRWTAVLGPLPARIGSAGVGTASETSTRTPAGTFTLTEAFGRAANPGTGLPYRVIDRQDWWVSDTASALYNRHARCAAGTCPFNEAAGENLYAQGTVYDHAVVIDYNRQGTPGAGSAFFLHVTNGAATAGCVAIGKGSLGTLLRWLNPGAAPLISLGVG